ncbi:MAG: hypothetical protein ABIO80_06195 [Sphingomicrobium sp.]
MVDQVQVYFHVRVLVAVVVGIAITRLLTGVIRLAQCHRVKPVSVTHLLWLVTVLLMTIHFWWFEFELIQVQSWHFELFIFFLFYAFLFMLMATVLVPEDLGEHANYNAYFMAHRGLFFGLLAATVPVDLLDTLLKGSSHFRSLGLEYPARLVSLLALCAVASWTRQRWFHLAFAACYLAYFVSWIVRLQDVIK